MIYTERMNLKTYFQTTTPAEREAFAKKVGTSVGYLYLCTRVPKNGKPRQPGQNLCQRMVKEDPRFTLAELRPDIWGAESGGVSSKITPTSAAEPPEPQSESSKDDLQVPAMRTKRKRSKRK